MSPGKREKPDGTSTRRASCAGGIAAFAWYMRIEEPIVPVSQKRVAFVRISSSVKLVSHGRGELRAAVGISVLSSCSVV